MIARRSILGALLVATASAASRRAPTGGVLSGKLAAAHDVELFV